MVRLVVYSLCLLLSIASCAKKKQSISCANPDPTTGACLSDQATVVDPNDSAAVMERAMASQEQMRLELQRLRNDKAVLEEQIASGQRPASDQTYVDQLAATINGTVARGLEVGWAAEPEVDTSAVPTVMLSFNNHKNTGVRPKFIFTHVTKVTDIAFRYGSGDSHVFGQSARFSTDKIQLAGVKIPINLQFKFGGQSYCAKRDLSREFEDGQQVMQTTVGGC